MPVIPTGDPTWVRTSDLTTYGGNPLKHNHLSQGVIDALTDVGAEQFSRMTGDLAAVARTAPFATLTFTAADGNVLAAAGMLGVRPSGYSGGSPPSGFPSLAVNGTGDVTLTFLSSYADPYGVAGAFVAQHPRAALVGTTPGSVVCQTVDATHVRVRAYDASGSPLANAVVCLTVGSGS